MSFEYAIKVLKDELKEQEDWYEGWKTTTIEGSSLPGKEKQIAGLKEAIQLLTRENRNERGLKIPEHLKCPQCKGRNLAPDPSVYFHVHIEGWGCLDCQGE